MSVIRVGHLAHTGGCAGLEGVDVALQSVHGQKGQRLHEKWSHV